VTGATAAVAAALIAGLWLFNATGGVHPTKTPAVWQGGSVAATPRPPTTKGKEVHPRVRQKRP
jgi:hypothetical protein